MKGVVLARDGGDALAEEFEGLLDNIGIEPEQLAAVLALSHETFTNHHDTKSTQMASALPVLCTVSSLQDTFTYMKTESIDMGLGNTYT